MRTLWVAAIAMLMTSHAYGQTAPAQGYPTPWRSFGKPNSARTNQTQTKPAPKPAAEPSSTPTKPSPAEQTLFDSVNRERQTRGLRPFKWDAALASAARSHAQKMAQAGTISHQFPGEMDLGARIHMVGVHFTEAAENVAQGPSAAVIHNEWMNSPPHRDNLLDRDLDSIGIAVVERIGQLFAVQDFSELSQ
jgi:uncharacterized protein YkwD